MYGGVNPGGAPSAGRPTRFWVILGAGVGLLVVLAILAFLLLDGEFGPTGSGARPVFGGFFLLFFLVIVASLVIRIAFWSSRGRGGYYGRTGPRRDPAVMMARQRYARGEITREQYEQIMTDLGRRGRGPGGPLSGA